MQYLQNLIKRTIDVNGTLFPAVQITEPENVVVETSQGKRIPTQFAWVISLRTPRGGGDQYLRLSRENLGFGGLRFDTVDGLDVDFATGEVLGLQHLEPRRMAQQAARSAERAAARPQAPQAVEVNFEDLGIEGEDVPEGAPAPA